MKEFILILSFLHLVLGQRAVGDNCVIRSTNKNGQCKLFDDCPGALENIKKNQIYPQTCGFQGSEPIICCEESGVQQISTTSVSSRETGKISLEKCREYSKYVIVESKAPTLSLFPENITKDECGHQVVELIVGGKPAAEKEFPHMAVLGYDNGPTVVWYCGGTLISDLYVLTAGHCINSRDYGQAKYVKVGINDLNGKDNLQQFNIVEHKPHPDYKPPSHYHDIALVKLHKPAKLNPYVIPACLYFKPTITAQHAIATGFGKTKFAGVSSDSLLKVTLDLIGHSPCNSSYRNQISRKLIKGIIDDIQICAGAKDPNEEKDTCQGDSGGPLQIYHIKDDIYCMYDVIGVTSFGKACSGSPGVYTRVSQYVKWIEDIVWP